MSHYLKVIQTFGGACVSAFLGTNPPKWKLALVGAILIVLLCLSLYWSEHVPEAVPQHLGDMIGKVGESLGSN